MFSLRRCGCRSCAEQNARPFNAKFPFLGQIYQVGNIYRSNYNGLQLTLTGRDYHGLTFLAGYTYSHALDDVGANWDFGAGSGLPMDSMHPRTSTPAATLTCAIASPFRSPMRFPASRPGDNCWKDGR